MAELLEALGHNIRRLREEKGWNQTELGFHADMSPSIVSLIENGKRNPSTATLAKIAGALDIEVVDLFPKVEAPLSQRSLFNGLEEERHYEKYEDVLKALGFGQEQIEAWKAQDARDKEFIERELERERRRIEKLSPKELREELMARSLAEKRLRRYYADQHPEDERRRAQQPEAG